MRRSLRAEELRLWARVAASVRPLEGASVPDVAAPEAPAPPSVLAVEAPASAALPPAKRPGTQPAVKPKVLAPPPPDLIEPLRRRRIVKGREPIEARLDLHGLDQDRARAALINFLRRAQGEGLRAVLVITGKGAQGDGILRRRMPDWLDDPLVRPIISGVSPADRRHGGGGAFYIALKRRA